MQQFSLFCTMLIITSEAFSEVLHGSQIFKSTARKYRLVPKHYCHNPDMLKFPMFPVPSTYKRPDYKPLFHAPTRRRRSKQNNYSTRNKKRLHMRKRFRKNKYKQRKRNLPSSLIMPDSFVLNSPQCFATSRLLNSGSRGRLSNNSSNYFADVNDVTIENPNQFTVCFYPVFNQFKKRTLDRSKKLRFSPSKRQCSTHVKYRVIKNKRSARTKSSFDDIEPPIDDKKIARSENRLRCSDRNRDNLPDKDRENLYGNCDTNLTLSQPKSTLPVSFNQPNDKILQEKKNVGGKSQDENINSEKLVHDSPLNINLTAKHKLQDLSPKFAPPFPSVFDNKLAVTQSPPDLTDATIKYQTDVNLYEPLVKKDDDFIFPTFETDVTNELDDNLDEDDTPTAYNITKLKKMLQDVESLLGNNDKVNIYGLPEKNTDEREKTTKTEKVVTAPNQAVDIKKKIDTEALPILKELSHELENVSSLLSTIVETKTTKKKGKIFGKLKKKFQSKKKAKTTENEDRTADRTAIEHCKADGTWKSTVFGFDLNFKTLPNLLLKVEVASPGDTTINNKWSIHGLTLSREGGPFMLAAVYPQKRKLASFIGQCKICKNQQMIFGVWTIYTCGRRFTDIWRAVETKLDILKKS